MNLRMALCAVGIKRRLGARTRPNVTQVEGVVEGGPFAVTSMAAQAEECCRLSEQVVGNCAVRIMTNCTVLSYGWMLVCKRALFLSMALVTHHIDGWLFQIVFCLPVRIMAIGASYLAFLDRMVRRHRVLRIDGRMTLVARIRLIDRHR